MWNQCGLFYRRVISDTGRPWKIFVDRGTKVLRSVDRIITLEGRRFVFGQCLNYFCPWLAAESGNVPWRLVFSTAKLSIIIGAWDKHNYRHLINISIRVSVSVSVIFSLSVIVGVSGSEWGHQNISIRISTSRTNTFRSPYAYAVLMSQWERLWERRWHKHKARAQRSQPIITRFDTEFCENIANGSAKLFISWGGLVPFLVPKSHAYTWRDWAVYSALPYFIMLMSRFPHLFMLMLVLGLCASKS